MMNNYPLLEASDAKLLFSAPLPLLYFLILLFTFSFCFACNFARRAFGSTRWKKKRENDSGVSLGEYPRSFVGAMSGYFI